LSLLIPRNPSAPSGTSAGGGQNNVRRHYRPITATLAQTSPSAQRKIDARYDSHTRYAQAQIILIRKNYPVLNGYATPLFSSAKTFNCKAFARAFGGIIACTIFID